MRLSCTCRVSARAPQLWQLDALTMATIHKWPLGENERQFGAGLALPNGDLLMATLGEHNMPADDDGDAGEPLAPPGGLLPSVSASAVVRLRVASDGALLRIFLAGAPDSWSRAFAHSSEVLAAKALNFSTADSSALNCSSIDEPPPAPGEACASCLLTSACGSWACGRPEGRGTYTSHLGSSFTGVWRRGWANGSGIYHWADGRCDISHYHGEADRLPDARRDGHAAEALDERHDEGGQLDQEGAVVGRARARGRRLAAEQPSQLPGPPLSLRKGDRG